MKSCNIAYIIAILHIAIGISDIIGCTHLSGKHGNVTSPGYPLPHTTNAGHIYQKCWTTPRSPYNIMFYFLDLDIEPACSHVKIDSRLIEKPSKPIVLPGSDGITISYYQSCSVGISSKHVGFQLVWREYPTVASMPTATLKTQSIPRNNSVHVLTEKSGIILSPGYPLSYPERFIYNWTIIAKQSNSIRLKVLYFNMPHTDNIKVYIRQNNKLTLRKSLTTLYRLPYSYSTTYDVVYIKMTSYEQTSTSRQAFAIQWNSTYAQGKKEGWGSQYAAIIGGSFGIIVLCCACKEKMKEILDKASSCYRSTLSHICTSVTSVCSRCKCPFHHSGQTSQNDSPPTSIIHVSSQTENGIEINEIESITERNGDDLPPAYTEVVSDELPSYELSTRLTDYTPRSSPRITFSRHLDNQEHQGIINYGLEPETDDLPPVYNLSSIELLTPSVSRSQSVNSRQSNVSNSDSIIISVRSSINEPPLGEHSLYSNISPVLPPPSYEDVVNGGADVNSTSSEMDSTHRSPPAEIFYTDSSSTV